MHTSTGGITRTHYTVPWLRKELCACALWLEKTLRQVAKPQSKKPHSFLGGTQKGIKRHPESWKALLSASAPIDNKTTQNEMILKCFIHLSNIFQCDVQQVTWHIWTICALCYLTNGHKVFTGHRNGRGMKSCVGKDASLENILRCSRLRFLVLWPAKQAKAGEIFVCSRLFMFACEEDMISWYFMHTLFAYDVSFPSI